jgi:hypothetical protein
MLHSLKGADSYGLVPLGFCGMASVGSSHSALTSGEDNEEASLLGCPPIGLSTN